MVTPELLSTFPILKSLPQTTLSQLGQAASIRKYARRGIVLNAGEQEENVCFLFEGRLQSVDFTIDGREVGLYFIEPGDFCGELALFDQGPQPDYVIALTSAVVVMIPLESLREIMLTEPTVVNFLGMRLASRLRQMTRQRSLLGLPNIAQRVCCQLWMLVDGPKAQAEKSSQIKNPPTHMEIAIMLNLSRESVTRVFQTLQAKEVVKRDGPSRLLINDVQALKEYAEGSKEL
ncbi:MAG: Crp/Fnr family transcriptional regulator [Pseudohongiellaceae bacterium]|nr:Crp/Fnr family transcriptional regulator [Pseudohongiellaceae bacterium]